MSYPMKEAAPGRFEEIMGRGATSTNFAKQYAEAALRRQKKQAESDSQSRDPEELIIDQIFQEAREQMSGHYPSEVTEESSSTTGAKTEK